MKVIHACTPDEALAAGVAILSSSGERQESRNGPVLVAPWPVVTVYQVPINCVSFSEARDANPFFHLMEALWMLAGRNDVALPAHYAPRLATFSDDGATLHGAYGFRWREYFGYDQLDRIVDDLAKNKDSRRAVLSMWDGFGDLNTAGRGGKDVPCNTQAYFRVRDSALDMTVNCRSNDIIWGAYGANVVHFSLLLIYMAARLSLRVGTYYQVSNNYHAYIERDDTQRLFGPGGLASIMPGYLDRSCHPSSSFLSPKDVSLFEVELPSFFDCAHSSHWKSRFLAHVVSPMAAAFARYKADDISQALSLLEGSPFDWHIAGAAWLRRRQAKRAQTQEVR